MTMTKPVNPRFFRKNKKEQAFIEECIKLLEKCSNCGEINKCYYSEFLNAWMCPKCGYLMPNNNGNTTIPDTLEAFMNYDKIREKFNNKMKEKPKPILIEDKNDR